jgi:hypothetical protein
VSARGLEVREGRDPGEREATIARTVRSTMGITRMQGFDRRFLETVTGTTINRK